MNRKALLIGSPGIAPVLKGVPLDLANYRSFLCSPLGGAWTQDEVTILASPSREEVLAQVAALTRSDYSFVLFSGHGCHEGDGTCIELKPGLVVNDAILKIGASKHTVLLDCCREVVPEVRLDEAMAKAAELIPRLDAVQCRRAFDIRVSECATGLVALYACSVGETAADIESEGGIYASSLVKAARTWHARSLTDLSKHFSILSVVEAHERASTLVRARTVKRQNPVAE